MAATENPHLFLVAVMWPIVGLVASLVAAPLSAETSDSRSADPFSVYNGWVAVEVEQIALSELLPNIGRATGIEIRFSAPEQAPRVNVSFDLPLDEAIFRLLDGASYVLEYGLEPERRIERIHVMSTGNVWSRHQRAPRVSTPPAPRAARDREWDQEDIFAAEEEAFDAEQPLFPSATEQGIWGAGAGRATR